MTAFDPTKPVQTRSGLPVRIICTDCNDDNFPIIALVNQTYDRETLLSVRADGRFYEGLEHRSDLINAPEVTKKYRRVYKGSSSAIMSGPYDCEQRCRSDAHVGLEDRREYYGILEEVYTDGEFTTINFIPW